MRVTVYDESGRPIYRFEGVLPSGPEGVGKLYVVYEAPGILTVSEVTREPGDPENEKVLAVRMGRTVKIYGEVPTHIAERLGLPAKRRGISIPA